MNALAAPFKQLVERRLWPVALLLVAGLVAVPVLLTKEPDTSASPVPLSAVPAGQGGTDSVVSLSDPASREEVRAVLGDRKDPFRPAQLHRVPKPEELNGATTAQATVDNGAQGSTDVSSGGGTTAPEPSTPTTPVAPTEPVATATPEATPEPTYELYSMTVRFGDVETGDLQVKTVKRLTGLPGGNPAVLYLGPTKGGDAAAFMVDAGVEVVGDGRCDPAPNNCETMELEEGETVFLTRGDKQYQLDLIRINTRTTHNAAQARKARSAVASGGPAALRRMGARARSYRYDAATGTVAKVQRVARGLSSASASFSSAG
jgi:hypothetical protein